MGGQAFEQIGAKSNPPFTTPRIPPETHERLKDVTVATVSKHFAKTKPLPDAPEKTDYGDVDIVVESPHTLTAINDISRELQARHIIHNSPLYHLAIPRLDLGRDSCAQLDILVCPPGDLEWALFLHGYGDLGQILGVMNHSFGFTANDKGFAVRIEEQEARNWKGSQVFLTKAPGKLMDFLHLKKEEFASGFRSEQQLFAWVSKCRLFDRNLIEKRKDDPDHRKRMQKRPMFQRFVSEYLPSLPDVALEATETRESLLKDALAFFDKGEQFATRWNIVLAENAEDRAWHLITTGILMPYAQLQKNRLNETVRGFRRFVAFSPDGPYIRKDPEMASEKQGRFAVMVDEKEGKLKPDMQRWILDHWEEVESLEKQRKKTTTGKLKQK